MNWKRIVTAFFSTFFVLFVLSYIIVTIVPVFACFVMIVSAACHTGSVINLVLSLLLYTGFLALLTTPFVVRYFDMKKKLEEYEDEDLV